MRVSTGKTGVTLLSALTMLIVAAGAAAAPLTRIDNFVLLDHTGQARELYYNSDARAVVLLVQSNSCPAMDRVLKEFNALADGYSNTEVRFWMLNSSPGEDRTSIARTAGSNNIDVPILKDNTQLIGEALDVRQAGELLVVDTKNWTIAYRGAVSGADAALDAVIAGNLEGKKAAVGQPTAAYPPLAGCEIDFAARDADHAAISYAETIAPMLKAHCAYCHVEGGIGPWAMTSYDRVRGFAPMIREVLRTRRMPPWHADPHIGAWSGDRSLSTADTRTLVHWIEAGAPRGDGPDPLAAVVPLTAEWPLGQPDLIVEIPGFEVPASGVVDYQFPYVKNELDHGVWITAATVLPGDRRVVHHVLAGSVEREQPPGDEDSVMDNYIIGYAPGAESYVMPEGTGVYVAPGGYYTFQLHYTPIGKVIEDNSKMGLYLSDEPPANFLRHTVVVSPNLSIPPNTPDHEEAAYYEFAHDVTIHTLFPHAHYRGKSSSFEVRYPDGRLETVLSVPSYDFNWQRGYNPVRPLELPAGSRLIHRTVYDNSAQNPSNPDPAQTIHWGLQSFEEMLYGAVSFSWTHETSNKPIHDNLHSQVTQLVGFLDRNMDGKVGWRELPTRMKKQLVQGFKAVDTNGDGGLDINEFYAVRKQANKRQTATLGTGG